MMMLAMGNTNENKGSSSNNYCLKAEKQFTTEVTAVTNKRFDEENVTF